MTTYALRRRLFWVVSRLAFGIYRRLPLFGNLRASVGVIRQGAKYLAIVRNDGRGLGLPGGLARWHEADEETVRREIAEETGLAVTGLEFAFRCLVSGPIPANIAVFRVAAQGALRGSWEGEPQWVSLSELRSHIVASQRPIIEQVARWTKGGIDP
jgi:ADP-ribose pyrophosphatase YjhB (NUDIX family)